MESTGIIRNSEKSSMLELLISTVPSQTAEGTNTTLEPSGLSPFPDLDTTETFTTANITWGTNSTADILPTSATQEIRSNWAATTETLPVFNSTLLLGNNLFGNASGFHDDNNSFITNSSAVLGNGVTLPGDYSSSPGNGSGVLGSGSDGVFGNSSGFPGNDSGFSSNNSMSEFWEYNLSLQVQAYAGIIIVLIGLIGNSLCIATLSHSKITSTVIYLINMACADLTVIFVGMTCRVLPRALANVDIATYHPYICKTWFFINHSAKTISGWSLVAVTIERVLVVFLPLKARIFCTKRRAYLAIGAINVLCMACYVHYYWTYGVTHAPDGHVTGACSILLEDPVLRPFVEYVRPWQDFVVRSAAPFTILLVSNCLIIGKLLHQQRYRKSLSGLSSHDERKMKSMTAMLLTVSFAYLICISPMQIMYLVDKSDPFGWEIEYRWQAQVALRWSFAIDVYYANHAINFILYVVSGREFRSSLIQMCLSSVCLRHKARLRYSSSGAGSSIGSPSPGVRAKAGRSFLGSNGNSQSNETRESHVETNPENGHI